MDGFADVHHSAKPFVTRAGRVCFFVTCGLRGVEDAPSYLRHHFSFLAHLVGVQRGCVFWRWRLVPTRVGVSPGRAPARIEGFWVASGTRVASTSVVVTASSELG